MVRAYLCVLVFLSLCVGASPLKSIVPFYQTEMGLGLMLNQLKSELCGICLGIFVIKIW